jgi:hypothetical protein
MVRAMRILKVLILLFVLIGPAMGTLEEVKLGPYNVSFDMNTTSEYDISVEGPTAGTSSDGVGFRRYNLTVDGDEGFAFLVLTEYDHPMKAGIEADLEIVNDVLKSAACDDPKLYQPLIDGESGVLGSCRYPSGSLLVVASYSHGGETEDGEYLAQTNCRVLSSFPWEITRDMLYTLHVEMPQTSSDEE